MMLSSKKQKAEGRKQKAEVSPLFGEASQCRKVFFCFLLSAFCLLPVGCRRDMQDQPKAIAYRQSSFFRDGLSSRPLVPGTVPRGYLRADREFYLGKKTNSGTATAAPATSTLSSPAALYPDDVETFPFPITKKALDRGQER